MFEGKRILTVDDSTTIRNYLRNLLSQQGAAVDGAGTGGEGLDLCAATPYDLVLLDLLLPDTDGIAVLTRLRETDDDCPVVMLTGEGGIRSATDALHQGADGYIEKHDVVSGDPAAFFYALQQAIERRRAIVEQRRLQGEVAEKVEALEASERKALEASRAKSTFLANMSHELRTPLNAIIGFIQLMQRDRSLDVEQLEHLAIIARSGEHLLTLINDILSLSKIEAGQLRLTEEVFDLPTLLQSIEEMFRMRAQTKNLQLIFDVAPGMPRYVKGDSGKLRQVLINLLGNAFKFTDTGGVALRARWHEGRCAFEIEDTGHGIAPDELAHLFEAFVQTQSGIASKEGTGLGLAISRNIVRLMGGDVAVRSQLGVGTMFAFDVELPVAERAEVPRPKGRVVGLEPGQERFRVVVADDRWENRMLLAKLLASVGFEVREAANGAEVVEMRRTWNPHVIWMDVRMPVIDGFEATRLIREYETTIAPDGAVTVREASGGGAPSASYGAPRVARTAIVALTASVFEQDRAAISAAGCDDFVAKPFRESTIFEKMAEHAGVRYLYEQPARAAAPAEGAPQSALGPDALAALPGDVVKALEEAVTNGDMEASYEVVERVRAANPALADELKSMVRAYRFDDILYLVERAFAEKQS